jgi:hypothetical protein
MKIKFEIFYLTFLFFLLRLDLSAQNLRNSSIRERERVKHIDSKYVDSEVYNPQSVVEINNLNWSRMNLAVTEAQGQNFYFASNLNEWKRFCSTEEAVYCYPNFDSSLVENYGYLYNQVAAILINRDSDIFFRVPRKVEWNNLFNKTSSPDQPYHCLSSEDRTDCETRIDFNLGTGGFIERGGNGSVQFKPRQQGFWAIGGSSNIISCIWFKEMVLMDAVWTAEDLMYMGASIRGVQRD